MSVHDQEMMIGRTKEANEEIDGDERPETSHLTRCLLYTSLRREENAGDQKGQYHHRYSGHL